MNMTPQQFGEIRLSDFWLKVKGFFSSREENFRLTAELARLQTADLINIQLKQEDRVRPVDLWKFPWDSSPENAEETNPADVAEFNRKLIAELEKAESAKHGRSST